MRVPESPPPIDIPASWLVRVLSRGLLLFFVYGGFFVYRGSMKAKGKEHLAGLGRVVVVSNHHSIFDTPFIFLNLPRVVRKRLSPVGGLDFFRPEPTHPLWARLWRRLVIVFIRGSLNVALIDRKGGKYSELDRLNALVERGWSLMVFPEATRSRSGTIGRFHRGAAELARRHDLPIVPVHITGTQDVLGVGMRWPRRGHVTIRFGESIDPAAAESSLALTVILKERISALGESPS